MSDCDIFKQGNLFISCILFAVPLYFDGSDYAYHGSNSTDFRTAFDYCIVDQQADLIMVETEAEWDYAIKVAAMLRDTGAVTPETGYWTGK